MRPEAIYLFGSRARGNARPDSDYDLLVVVADDAPREARSLAATTRVARDPGVALDIIPCRRSVFERRRNSLGTLSYLAAHEGRLVYGR
jgi:predicted nucleotidyltransferase